LAEALDALHALVAAGLVWLVLLAGAAGLAVYALTVAAAWPCVAARDALGGALAASRAVRAVGDHNAALRAAQRRLIPTRGRGDDMEEAA
jgi:type IV secretory pathway TrbF-like protein